MKKLIFSLFAVLTVGTFAFADTIPNGITPNGFMHTVITSSGSVFKGAGTVYAIQVSTGYGQPNDYYVVIDTKALFPNTIAAYSGSDYATPNLPAVTSTATISGVPQLTNFGPYGIYMNNGCFVYGFNGTVNTAVIYWKR